jgi:hypothetical protein
MAKRKAKQIEADRVFAGEIIAGRVLGTEFVLRDAKKRRLARLARGANGRAGFVLYGPGEKTSIGAGFDPKGRPFFGICDRKGRTVLRIGEVAAGRYAISLDVAGARKLIIGVDRSGAPVISV